MKARKTKGTARRATTIDIRLSRDAHGHVASFAKFAGVTVPNVVKIALAHEILRSAASAKPAPAAPAPSLGQRFTKLDSSGKLTTGEHVAVQDAKTGLTWMAEPVAKGKDLTHAEAMKACGAVDLFGHADWRAPTIEELLSIVDYTRYDPAVDSEYFKGPYGWTWSSTPAKAPAGFAWLVYLNFGLSNRGPMDLRFRVRAVRSGQQLGLLE